MLDTIYSLPLAIALLGQAAPDADGGDVRKEQLAFLKSKGAELTLRSGTDATVTLPLKAEPVLRYSNEERFDWGSSDGATFLWLEGAIPVAAVSLSIRRPNNAVHRECTSLISKPLTCETKDGRFWRPKSGGLLAQTFDFGVEPAANKTQRLTQMRSLAQRFSVDCNNSKTNVDTQLRLLTTPIYRYVDEVHGVVDGALFAFVISNDPEMFLLLEAVARRPGDKAVWQFSLARMSSHKETVRLDGKEIWTIPNFHQDLAEEKRTGTGPYTTTQIDTFVLAATQPQK